MDRLTFITKVLEALAWPIVTLWLGYMFREKILEILPAIKKLKAGPIEAEFEIAAKEVLAVAAEATLQGKPNANVPPATLTADAKSDIVTRVLSARSDPTRMIIEGWNDLDGELFRLGHQLGLTVDPLSKTEKVYQEVMATDVLPSETKKLVRQLRALRNDVAHAKVMPTTEAATDYLIAVGRAVELVLNYRKNLPNYGSTNR